MCVIKQLLIGMYLLVGLSSLLLANEDSAPKQPSFAKQSDKKIALKVVSKTFQKPQIYAIPPEFRSYINLSIVAYNNTQKSIRGVEGKLIFKDLFGHTITSKKIELTKTISPSEAIRQTTSLQYNGYIGADKRLKNTRLEDLKIKWHPSHIIFNQNSVHKHQSSYQPSKNGITLVEFIASDFFISSKHNWQFVTERTASAPTILDAYHANPFKGDNRYKNKTVMVHGDVRKIIKDSQGNAFIKIGPKPSQYVVAKINKDHTAKVGDLATTDYIRLICQGSGLRGNTPFFTQCRFAKEKAKETIQTATHDWFYNGKLDLRIPKSQGPLFKEEFKKIMIIFYILGSELSDQGLKCFINNFNHKQDNQIAKVSTECPNVKRVITRYYPHYNGDVDSFSAHKFKNLGKNCINKVNKHYRKRLLKQLKEAGVKKSDKQAVDKHKKTLQKYHDKLSTHQLLICMLNKVIKTNPKLHARYNKLQPRLNLPPLTLTPLSQLIHS